MVHYVSKAETEAMAQGPDLRKRVAELRDKVDKQGIEWQSRLDELPDDPVLQIAALATLLEIDALGALQEDVSLDVLEDRGRDLRRLREEMEREVARYLREVDSSREGA
jgi:hypothetical protein